MKTNHALAAFAESLLSSKEDNTMKLLFGAGHVEGAKIWMGYNEDENMLDLARREARYAADRYGQETAVFSVTKTSYNAVQAACTGYDLSCL